MNKITLYIDGVGNIKSLKNNKMVPARGRTILTKPDAWKQQKKIVDQLESQLYSALGISGDTTLTEQREQFSTVSSELVEDLLTFLPDDDNYMLVPDTRKISMKIDKGEEGVIIHIERYEPGVLERIKGGFHKVKDKASELFQINPDIDIYR